MRHALVSLSFAALAGVLAGCGAPDDGSGRGGGGAAAAPEAAPLATTSLPAWGGLGFDGRCDHGVVCCDNHGTYPSWDFATTAGQRVRHCGTCEISETTPSTPSRGFDGRCDHGPVCGTTGATYPSFDFAERAGWQVARCGVCAIGE